MKALSLIQPWATAVALGLKFVEDQPWNTHYRGELAIHASTKRIRAELLRDLGLDLAPADLPLGAIVATCRLVRVRRVGQLDGSIAYDWQLAGVRPLEVPVPWPGRPGLSELPDHIAGQVRFQERSS